MKKTKLLLLFVCCFAAFSANAQTETPKSEMKIVKLNCMDSLGFVTNINSTSSACEFYFHKSEETPTMFYIPNLSHDDLYALTFDNDLSKISKVRLVRENHVAAIHDFIYCYNKDNPLMFYYILADQQEEKRLVR